MSHSRSSQMDQHYAMPSAYAQWQHGAITPVHSPQPKLHSDIHLTAFSASAADWHSQEMVPQIPVVHMRPLPAQMLPPDYIPPSQNSISSINELRGVSTGATRTNEAPNTSSTDRMTQPRPANRPQGMTASAQNFSKTVLRAQPRAPVTRVDFPQGIVDPTRGTYNTPKGPPQWQKSWMLSTAECNIGIGLVNSPTFMIGLPFGGTIETAACYPPGDQLPGHNN